MAIVYVGEPVLAPDAEAPRVRELNDALAESEGMARLITPSEEVIELPHSVFTVLMSAVQELNKRNAVRILPVHAELTTQQAADLLNVSRPFLVGLLEKGMIRYSKVGTHRRIKLVDLLIYKDKRDSERLEVLDELANESQELGLYDV